MGFRKSSVENMERLSKFLAGKRVLVTGHTGFKGSWLTSLLLKMDADVSGIALPPESGGLYEKLYVDSNVNSKYLDIRNSIEYSEAIREINPEIVLNLAAKALVRESYKNPLLTWQTNLMGTANLLEALRQCDSCRVAVLVTTDKVYKESSDVYAYREDDALGGHDPYSASKAASELLIESYKKSFFGKNNAARIATVRAGNVIGGGDWSSNRLVPDLVRAWTAGSTAYVRNPNHRRPWQHVLDVLASYLLLVEKLWQSEQKHGSFNIGPMHSSDLTVLEISNLAAKYWPEAKIALDVKDIGPHENSQLFLDSSRAMRTLGYFPKWDIEMSVERTINWYRESSKQVSAKILCERDIDLYMNTVAK
jgi:CDP-glucose 4,6-dehydratase